MAVQTFVSHHPAVWSMRAATLWRSSDTAEVCCGCCRARVVGAPSDAGAARAQARQIDTVMASAPIPLASSSRPELNPAAWAIGLLATMAPRASRR